MKRAIIIIICLSFLAGENMYGQNNQYLEIAQETLVMFRCSVNVNNYKFYGLSSADGLEKVSLGEAVEHRGVPLNSLREYDESQDPRSIIKEMGYVTVALKEEGSNRAESFVLLNQRDGKYQSTGIGQDFFSKWFMEMKEAGIVPQESRLVRVPAMNIAFGTSQIDGVLHLTPISSERGKQGDARPANIVFAELVDRIVQGEDVPH